MVTFENAQYSVPAHLLGVRVFVRSHGCGPGEQVIIVHHGRGGSIEVARHGRARPGRPAIQDEHFPGARTRIPGDYTPKPRRPGLDPERQHQTHHHPRGGRDPIADPGHRCLGRPGRSDPQHRKGAEPMSPVSTTNTTAPALPAELEAVMRQLKMPHARALAPELIATARAQRWEPVEIIKALFAEEAGGRARSMLATRRKAAGLPTGKTFEAWDPTVSSILGPTQQALRTLEWITRREHLVVCGPSGTGETFFREALGQQAVEAGMRVAWFRLEDLGALIRAHRTDDSVTRAVTRILRAELVVIDDTGLLPVGTDAAEGLYRVVDAAYEKRSVAISSNLHPAGFDELMPKPSPRPPLTGSCTTPTSARPAATPTPPPRPSLEKESPN